MVERFSRQVRFAGIGPEGQRRIQQSRILLVGVGALGTHLASTLVRAGVGAIWLVDRDVVELSNLQRQLLFTEEDARRGRPKALAAAEHLAKVQSDCELIPLAEDFDRHLFGRIGELPDLILDGTDNFATRYLLNDLAVSRRIPWIYGGAVGSRGTAMVVVPHRTPCLRCVLPDTAPAGEVGTCETDGILAPTIAAVSAFQSAQALALLARGEAEVARGVFTIDVWTGRSELRLRSAEPSAECPACTRGEFPALEHSTEGTVRLCGRNATQVTPRSSEAAVDLGRLATRLHEVATDVELTPHLLRFKVEECGFSVFRGGRTLVFGIDDPVRARVLYDRYVGAG